MSPGGEYSVMGTMLMATKIFISLMGGRGGGVVLHYPMINVQDKPQVEI